MRNGSALLVTVTLVACAAVGPAQAAELFISEYVEGSAVGRSDFDDAIELLNPFGFALDLSLYGYFLDVCLDGALPGACVRVWLTGTVPSGGTFVITNPAADPALQAVAQQIDTSVMFDGNDAVILGYLPQKGDRQFDVYVDVIGQAGILPPLGCWCYPPATCTCDDPLSTLDAVLRRDASFTGWDVPIDPTAGFTFDPAVWSGFAAGSWSGLGVPGDVPVTLQTLTID